MKRAVIFDLDGTLADVRHRRHHVQKEAMRHKCCLNPDCADCHGNNVIIEPQAPDWDSWNAEMHLDLPNGCVIEMFNYHRSIGDQIIICTGRFRKFNEVTLRWLKENNIIPNMLFMRPDGNYDSDYIVKKEMLEHIRGLGIYPHLSYDDRDSVVKMWREQGLTCFQVSEGPF